MRVLSISIFFVSLCNQTSSLRSSELPRRSILEHAIAAGNLVVWTAASPAANAVESSYTSRFESDLLYQPPITAQTEINGVDNTYFPSWLAGTWNVTQTLVRVEAPLGLAFAGGPNGVESIGKQTIEDSAKQLNIPVHLSLKFVSTPWGVAEDRIFNTAERLNAFSGRAVVASVDYADVGGSNRASVLAMGGTEETPLQTTFVRFKGPAAQKSFVVSHSPPPKSDLSNSWSGFELQRSIFALTNTNTAPPITTDTEYLWSLRLAHSKQVEGTFRIAGYLNPTDKLYFDAKKRAVTLQDYTLQMIKVE